MKNDAGDGMNHRGECGNRENITCDFNGAFFSGTLDFLDAFGMRHRADVPDVEKDFAGLRKKERRKFAIVGPSTGDGAFVDGAGFGVEEERDRGDVGLGTVHADITLALLLGIVERMGVKERPDELAADVFETEFEMRVLIDGVVAAEKSGGADVETLLVGDFFWPDETRGVASARGGDCGIEGMRGGVAESNARWSGLNEFAGISALKHARLGGHSRESFYTEGR